MIQEDTVMVYAEGLLSCSACAPASLDAPAVEAAVNAACPSGTRAGWQCSSDPVFAAGEPQPGPCNQQPESRRHWLLEC